MMGTKILIVDDEPNIILMVSTRLKANGYETISAGDGQTGFEMAQKEKPDLVILDLMLPKMDGYKVCALLKRDYRYSKIPILMFTAKAQPEDVKLAEEMGADAFMPKPFRPDELLAKIKELLPKG